MHKSLSAALGLAAVSAVCIAAAPRGEPEPKTQTIAEYMDEYWRTHPSIEANKSIPVATSQLAVCGEGAAGLDLSDEESQAVPDAECYEALEMVLNGWDGASGALYFEADWNESQWHKENLQELFQYGNLIFYKGE